MAANNVNYPLLVDAALHPGLRPYKFRINGDLLLVSITDERLMKMG